jgi:anti-anti-sigma factor
MKITNEERDIVNILNLAGEFNKAGAAQLEQIINRLIDKSRVCVLLNFEELQYIDSQAIMHLLKMNREVLASGGAIKLLRPGNVVKRFLNISKVFDFFERFETKVDAIRSFENFRHVVEGGQPKNPLAEHTARQRQAIFKLLDILMDKGIVNLEEFNDEFNESSQMVLEMFKQHFMKV